MLQCGDICSIYCHETPWCQTSWFRFIRLQQILYTTGRCVHSTKETPPKATKFPTGDKPCPYCASGRHAPIRLIVLVLPGKRRRVQWFPCAAADDISRAGAVVSGSQPTTFTDTFSHIHVAGPLSCSVAVNCRALLCCKADLDLLTIQPQYPGLHWLGW